jgi:lysophospholipase L1-like esterase
VLDAAYLERFRGAVDELLAAGTEKIVWLTTPPIHPGRLRPELEGDPQGDPARMERYNELVRQVAAEVPEVVVLDLASLVASWPEDLDRQRRVDGIHFSPEAAEELVETWLGPELLEVFSDLEGPGGVASGA